MSLPNRDNERPSFAGACLQVIGGEAVVIGEHCSMGRHRESSILIEGKDVSRWHAVVVRVREDEFWLMDLETKNGTYRNRERLLTAVMLADLDVIGIGGVKMRFHATRERTEMDPVEQTTTVTNSAELSADRGDLFEPVEQGVAVVDARNALVAATPSARTWFKRYFPRQVEESKGLPRDLLDWLELQQLRQRENEADSLPKDRLVLSRQSRRLTVRLAEDTQQQVVFLLMVEETPLFTRSSLIRDMSKAFGMGKREGEVLYYVIQGKTSPEVGIILELSERTVEAHLAKAMKKLKIRKRQEAVLFVIRYFKGLRRQD